MARQIASEDALSSEEGNTDSEMTEAESHYLQSMEEVKIISKQLVGAEQAFALVRDRIEKLISKYKSMLLKIETQSFTAASSVVTYESSYYSQYDTSEYWNEQEQIWARRAQRAEIKAELAAREAALAKLEARTIKEEKLRELQNLQKKLDDLQSISSSGTAEKVEAVRQVQHPVGASALILPESTPSVILNANRISKAKLDDVKQRFRERLAAKKQQDNQQIHFAGRAPLYPTRPERRAMLSQVERELLMSAGEEMCQQMDFYERSLKAVDTKRDISNNA